MMPRPSYLAYNVRISNCTHLLLAGRYSVREFLRRASHAVPIINYDDVDIDNGDSEEDDFAAPPEADHQLEPLLPIPAPPQRRRRIRENGDRMPMGRVQAFDNGNCFNHTISIIELLLYY